MKAVGNWNFINQTMTTVFKWPHKVATEFWTGLCAGSVLFSDPQ